MKRLNREESLAVLRDWIRDALADDLSRGEIQDYFCACYDIGFIECDDNKEVIHNHVADMVEEVDKLLGEAK